jgi:hypothetical protein
MYTGAMEPSCLIGVCPLGWGVGWAVTRKQGVGQLSKAEEPESKVTKLRCDRCFIVLIVVSAQLKKLTLSKIVL